MFTLDRQKALRKLYRQNLPSDYADELSVAINELENE